MAECRDAADRRQNDRQVFHLTQEACAHTVARGEAIQHILGGRLRLLERGTEKLGAGPVGILFTAFGCLLGMLALNGLPRLYHALFKSRNFHRFSDHSFFISIEARDPRFSLSEAKKLLEEIGGRNIEVLED